MSEFRLAPKDWPDCLRIVQKTLNESPLERLGKSKNGSYRSPLELMTGIRPNSKVLTSKDDDRFRDLSMSRVHQLINADKLQSVLEEMYKDTKERIDKSRQRQIERFNKKVNIVQPNFQMGDFVLVRSVRDARHKLAFKWQGPRRIVSVVNSLVYDVERLDTKERERVHACRMHFYKHALVGKDVSPELLSHARHTEAHYESIESLVNIKKVDDGYFIQVHWEGLPDEDDFTWEPLKNLYEDTPDLVVAFLQGCRKNLGKEALRTLDV